eukprot:scaffold317_cov260-Pinguiococcus_pyrenoidosus.AAC.18
MLDLDTSLYKGLFPDIFVDDLSSRQVRSELASFGLLRGSNARNSVGNSRFGLCQGISGGFRAGLSRPDPQISSGSALGSGASLYRPDRSCALELADCAATARGRGVGLRRGNGTVSRRQPRAGGKQKRLRSWDWDWGRRCAAVLQIRCSPPVSGAAYLGQQPNLSPWFWAPFGAGIAAVAIAGAGRCLLTDVKDCEAIAKQSLRLNAEFLPDGSCTFSEFDWAGAELPEDVAAVLQTDRPVRLRVASL